MTPETNQCFPDADEIWRDFYSKLTSRNTLPGIKEERNSEGEISIRDLVLDISNVKSNMTFAYCDVVTMSLEETILDFSAKGGFLFLIGRTFSAIAPRRLALKVGGGTTTFIYYATERQQSLTVVFMEGLDVHAYELTPDAINIGVKITYRNHASNRRSDKPAGITIEYLPVLEEQFQIDPVLERLVQTQLRIASLTMFTYPKLSLSIVLFVCRITQKSRVAATTHLEASTLLDQLLADLRHNDPNVWVMPSVTMNVYENTIAALLTAASRYSIEYERFIDKKDHASSRYNAARIMVEQSKGASTRQCQLLQQAKAWWEDAVGALRFAQRNAEEMRREVCVRSESFRSAVTDWVKEQRIKVAVMVVTSVVELGISLASVLVGNPTGAVGSPSLVIETIEAISELKSTMGDVIDTLEGVVQQFQAISTVINSLDQATKDTENNIHTILSGDFDVVAYAQRLSIPDPNGTNAIASWDAWLTGVVNLLQTATDNKIPTSGDYIVSLKQQAIYGKAQCLAKAAAVKSGQEYARALLQYREAEKQQIRFVEWTSDIHYNGATFEEQSAAFFDRLLSIKTFAVIQLRNYRNSYKYFSQRDSVVVLDMEKSVLELRWDFATLKQELAAYLSAFSSDPQPFTLTTVSGGLPSNQQVILADIQTCNRCTLTFDKDNRGPFAGLFHVRLKGLRVWFHGVKSKATAGAETIVKVQIETNGLYGDFSESSFFMFATTPLRRIFWYQLENSGPGKVLVDSVIPDGFHNPPTPFTQWTVTLMNPIDLDLSGLTSITFEWVGTTYGCM